MNELMPESARHQLLPCPFCGGCAETRSDIEFSSWTVMCIDCSGHNCGDTENDAVTEWNNRATQPHSPDAADSGRVDAWRCFHCDETFTDASSATEHFGASERQNPACQIDIAEYRSMEARMVRYNDEDADIHRQMYGMKNEHQQALRRAEEDGYAKGLAALQPPQPVRSVSEEDARTCKGANCTAMNGIGHSPECLAERASCVDPLNTPGNRHPEHRYAGYKERNFTGSSIDHELAYEEGRKAAIAQEKQS